jgi:hypothetical protein
MSAVTEHLLSTGADLPQIAMHPAPNSLGGEL